MFRVISVAKMGVFLKEGKNADFLGLGFCLMWIQVGKQKAIFSNSPSYIIS